jgi:hypothetical protein
MSTRVAVLTNEARSAEYLEAEAAAHGDIVLLGPYPR